MSLSTMKKAELKALCQSNGIYLTGKELRPDLIELLTSNGIIVSRKKAVASDIESESEVITSRSTKKRARKTSHNIKSKLSDLPKKLYAITIGPAVSFTIRKNDWILATLSYPKALVELQILLEFVYLLSKYVTITELAHVLPLDDLPAFLSKIPIADLSFLSSSHFWSPFFIWSFVTIVIPHLAAFYVNYTMLTFDPVVIAATRTLFAYAILQVNEDSIYVLASDHFTYFGVSDVLTELQDFVLAGIIEYGPIFGRIPLVISIFTTVINIYGSIALLLD